MQNMENVDNLTIETIYEMVLEMKSKLDFLESETRVLQSDKAGLYMESIEPRLGRIEAGQVKMQTDIESMEAGQVKMQTDIESIEAGQVKMQADIESIELRLSKVETDMTIMKLI